MSALSIPTIVMASISFYVGLYHLLIYFRRRQHRENLTFALMCLAIALYEVCCAGLYNATSVAEGAQWQRMQFIALGFFTTAFLWFVADYTHQKPTKAIYAFSAFYLLAVLIQIVDRSSLTWLGDHPAVKEILLPFGLEITYYEVALGPFTTLQSLMGMVAATYIVWKGICFYKRGYRQEPALLLLALGFMYAAAINDTAVSNGLYQFVYAIEYAYLAMILLMAYSLSNTVVDAAMAKEVLREKTEELDRFFTVALDLLCIADTDGYFRRLNPQWEVVLGYALPELEGQRFLDLVHPDDQASTLAALSELGAQKTVLNFVNRYRCRDGSYRWIEWRSYPAGNLIYAAARDITERKQVEAELQTSEARYRALVQSQLDLVSRYLPDTTLTFVNDAYCQFYGKTREELIGVSYLTMVAPEFHEQALQETENFLKDPRPISGEYLNYRWDGQECWIHWILQGIVDDNGRVVEIQATGRDITPLKQAEEKIRQLNEELERRVEERTAQLAAANKELEAFSYSVSHDLRAPLRAIDGYTRILVEDYEPVLDAEGKRVCDIIRDNTQRMSQLIDDLLTFSRLSRAHMQAASIDMVALVTSVFQELITPHNQKRLDFQLEPLPPALGDPTLLRQVWVNLLSNALKFSAKREWAVIEVSGRAEVGENIYTVRDNGAGFDMRYVDKLFGVFQRLHSAREFEGTGVGLAIVQRIIHRHGGRVWAEGAVDQGASVYFTLPRKGD